MAFSDKAVISFRFKVILVFLGLSAALFCSLLDQTIVSTILPSINHEFNAANEGSW